MSPKQLQAMFRTVCCKKAIGAKWDLSTYGTTLMANGEAKVAKERIEAVELEKNLITFRVLDGDLMKEYKSFVITIQVTNKHGEPGSIVHWHLEYEKISDAVAHPETLLQFCVEVSKEIDEHLLAEEEEEVKQTETSSLLGKLETDLEIKASAEKFHHMWSGKPHHVSKASPGNIQGCDLHEGDWGTVGSIIFWNYVHDGEAKVAKERIEAVEPDKNLITFRVIEGDLMKEYKSFVATIQVTPNPKHGGSGSIVHWHLEYEKISEEVAHPETLLQLCVEISKEIDEHLLAEE
ncbi:MLP-like protein 34 isoform X2 [Capsella rubella]|uniref:MLP-like protein 34 isoform X2 n=1 Tax=Capsella rubella TaxID=81985 RepID=UPI000CD53F3D|nr:MLP-like protein 34 isoform X2 [Capsella rubella]